MANAEQVKQPEKGAKRKSGNSLPPLNKFFKAKGWWSSFATDGERSGHGLATVIAIRTGTDTYSFIHKGEAYLYESVSFDFEKYPWVLV